LLTKQRPFCVWLTGLPAAGKSTIAEALVHVLREDGVLVYSLDGDRVREALNRDLGYTAADRAESVRRVSEVARLMVDSGLVVIVSLISPFRADRDAARSLFEPGTFIEVYVDTPLEICEGRDPKGHYRKARLGELMEFTGVSSDYERPVTPDIHLAYDGASPEAQVRDILAYLQEQGLLSRQHSSGIS
jgi:bifunctional enzyme CysN/CysC